MAFQRMGSLSRATRISFIFSYLVRTLSEHEMTAELLHPAVDILTNHDQRNESELLKTLDIYLQQGMNRIATAQDLFIHRNTLKYRLKKIEELTHIDFDDPEEKLYLSLSMKLAIFASPLEKE